ncbi:MAG: hypothetical protein V4550_14940 [Gemmatimonadota bacterium]
MNARSIPVTPETMRILLLQGGPATAAPGGAVVVGRDGGLFSEYHAQLRIQRGDVYRQLQELERTRNDLAVRFRESPVGSAERKVLDDRLSQIGGQIDIANKILGDIESRISKVENTPVTVEPADFPTDRPTHQMDTERITLTGAFALCMPLVIAAAIRLLRRSAPAPTPAASSEMLGRLQKIEQLVESTAIEVERIGEGQRYMTKLLAESEDAVGVRAPTRGGQLPP